jgi:hypothetical protein
LIEIRPSISEDATMLLSLQVFTHFQKRANDYLVFESAVKSLLDNPVAMYGWLKLRIRRVCTNQEHRLLLLGGTDVQVSPEDRHYRSYVVPSREDQGESEIDLGRYSKRDPRPMGTGMDEFTFRHPGTLPEDDEQVEHLGQDNTEYSPITTKASQHLQAIAFVGKEIYGRLLPSYKNQFSIRIDNSRRCINYDCYEFKPEGGRHRSQDQNHLPSVARVNRYHSTISCGVPGGVQFINDPQDIRSICHIKALSGDFFQSRCYRFRLPLDNVSGIRLLKDPTLQQVPEDLSKEEEEEEDDDNEEDDMWDVPGALVLELSQVPSDPATFCVRTVAADDNSFKPIGDWTPKSTASSSTRHYVYGSFEELKELAANLCVIDSRIARLFKQGGGSLQGSNLAYSHARGPDNEPSMAPIAPEDAPKESSFDGSLLSLVDCVKDRLIAMSEAGNHEGAIYIAQNLGMAG